MLLKFMFWLFAIPLAWADLTFGPATSEPSHISLGSFQAQSVSYGTNTTPFWQNTSPPVITAFSVSPTSIDLDTRATGTISFTLAVTGNPGRGVASSRDVTFSVVGNLGAGTGYYGYNSSDTNFINLRFRTEQFSVANVRNTYRARFSDTFVKRSTAYIYVKSRMGQLIL